MLGAFYKARNRSRPPDIPYAPALGPRKHPIAGEGKGAYGGLPTPMLFMLPIWRSFRDIPADAEAAFASSASLFSLSTLEITRDSGFPGFALTERRQHDMWRWALVNAKGRVMDEGWEPTESDARRSAVGAMRHVMEGGTRPTPLALEDAVP